MYCFKHCSRQYPSFTHQYNLSLQQKLSRDALCSITNLLEGFLDCLGVLSSCDPPSLHLTRSPVHPPPPAEPASKRILVNRVHKSLFGFSLSFWLHSFNSSISPKLSTEANTNPTVLEAMKPTQN